MFDETVAVVVENESRKAHPIDTLALETFARYLEAQPLIDAWLAAAVVRFAIRACEAGSPLDQEAQVAINELIELISAEDLWDLLPEGLVPRARVVEALRKMVPLTSVTSHAP